MRISGFRKIGLACVAAALTATTACGSSDPSDPNRLVAANYGGITGEAIARGLEQPYAAATGVTFQQVNVASGFAAKLQAQRQSGKITWDVIEGLSGSDAAVLNEQGLLEPLPGELRTRLEQVSLPGAVTSYGLSLGDTGIVIACARNRVQACPKNVAQFWDVNAFPGRRALIDNPAQMLASALVADGVPGHQVYPMDVDRAIAKLGQLRPAVNVWTTSGDQQMQVLRDGQVDLALMWNGRAKGLLDEGVALDIEWGGSLVNPNYLVVVKGGPNTRGAMAFLEWYGMHPEAQASLARDLAYGMASKEVTSLVSPEQAALLPAAHPDGQVRLDPAWWVSNAKEVEPKWRTLLAG